MIIHDAYYYFSKDDVDDCYVVFANDDDTACDCHEYYSESMFNGSVSDAYFHCCD